MLGKNKNTICAWLHDGLRRDWHRRRANCCIYRRSTAATSGHVAANRRAIGEGDGLLAASGSKVGAVEPPLRHPSLPVRLAGCRYDAQAVPQRIITCKGSSRSSTKYRFSVRVITHIRRELAIGFAVVCQVDGQNCKASEYCVTPVSFQHCCPSTIRAARPLRKRGLLNSPFMA